MVLNEFDIEVMLKRKRHDLSMMSYQEFKRIKASDDYHDLQKKYDFYNVK